jgi:hypothetical protein
MAFQNSLLRLEDKRSVKTHIRFPTPTNCLQVNKYYWALREIIRILYRVYKKKRNLGIS